MLRSLLLALAASVKGLPQGGGSLGSTAMLRFGCSQVVIERLDPYDLSQFTTVAEVDF